MNLGRPAAPHGPGAPRESRVHAIIWLSIRMHDLRSSLMIQTQSESQPNYEMICTTRGHKDGVVYNGTCADSSVYTRKNPGVIRPLVFSPPPPVVTLSSGHRYQSVSSVLRQNYFDSTPGCDDTPPRRGRREVAASRKEIFLSNDANACPQEAFRHEREKKRTYAGIPNRKEAQRHFVELADAAKRSGDWREARRFGRCLRHNDHQTLTQSYLIDCVE